MSNGWTGGQYSIFRYIFGVYLLVHFVHLLPWAAEMFSSSGVLPDAALSPFYGVFPNLLFFADSPLAATLFVGSAAVASILFMIGRFDRIAAVWIWYVLACVFTRNPLTLNPSLPYVGWLMLVHAAIPLAPYGSLAAKNRVDPDGGWKLAPSLFGAAWILMAVGYSYSGYMKLSSVSWVDGTALEQVMNNPLARDLFTRDLMLALPPIFLKLLTWGSLGLELLFAPLALSKRLRPWLWISMVGMHIGILSTVHFADLTLGMLVLHVFTFDPAWIKPKFAGRKDFVFFDGECGLCHSAVRTILAEDREGGFSLSPLQGDLFKSKVDDTTRTSLPDSIVVLTEDGKLLLESDAVLYVMSRFGGLWRAISFASGIVPKSLRDFGYRCVAKVRKSIFKKPEGMCPLMPRHLAERFAY